MPSSKKARIGASYKGSQPSKKGLAGKKGKAHGARKSATASGSGRRKIRMPHPATPAKEWVTVHLRTPAGEVTTLQSSKDFQRAAAQWSYILCNRRRWNTSESAREEQIQRCQTELDKLGIKRDHLRGIAESDVVEVAVPFTSEEDGWEARVFPWEYMLSAATRPFRQGKALTVIRHLQRQTKAAHNKKPEKLLIIESAPGELGQQYTFDSERHLVESSLGLRHEIITDGTRQSVGAKITGYAPDVIHLSGFDTNQAVTLGVLNVEEVLDGYLLTGDPGVDPVEAKDLARLLNAAARKPALVSCNIFYSAQRVSSLIVAEGAGAAIGFQDEFEDALTELFFDSFYEAWRRFNWDTLEAFKYACNLLKQQPQRLMGTGVVLWSAQSLVKPQSEASERVRTDLLTEKKKVITVEDLHGRDARKLLSVEVKTCNNLNYSTLHNNCELFEKFMLRKEKDPPGCVNDIQVDVVLYVGGESSRYSGSVDMAESSRDLNKDIRVPLFYSIDFLNNENVHTGLFVEVSWQKQLLHRQTYRVTLPPIDEWRGNDAERVWLPSFVLPRDPAVSKIVDVAQAYVMALRDDSSAGFDGYQAVDAGADKPYDGVDQQVRALWAALLYNMNISYINPPPTYNIASQRLRTPSEIINGRRGTCIDLALLLAACLEYVDIFPVIFLFKNHALPGYWRSDKFQNDFKKVAEGFQTPIPPAGEKKGDLSTVQRWPWYHGKNAYQEIMQEVANLRIVPMETVGITQRSGYLYSVGEGIKKLENKDGDERFSFEAMIDIMQARDSLITPIPRR
ncbi:MAG TPA: hypothetical protein VE262_04475 [Blastocatellia bacterium]|nr:hypothetical protein [Blastocatellia bacterium]